MDPDDDKLEDCLRGLIRDRVSKPQHEKKCYSTKRVSFKPSTEIQKYLRACPSNVHAIDNTVLKLELESSSCAECGQELAVNFKTKPLFLKETIFTCKGSSNVSV